MKVKTETYVLNKIRELRPFVQILDVYSVKHEVILYKIL